MIIEIKIDTSSKKDLDGLLELAQSLVGSKPTSKSRKKPSPAPKAEQDQPTVDEDQLAADEESDNNEVTLDALKKQLRKTAKDDRPTVKDKLTDMGAQRLTALKPDQYQEMYDFLIKLNE